MGPGAPTSYCNRCDTSVCLENGRCPRCDSPATPSLEGEGDGWNDLRIAPEELSLAPPPNARVQGQSWHISSAPTAQSTADAAEIPVSINQGLHGDDDHHGDRYPPLAKSGQPGTSTAQPQDPAVERTSRDVLAEPAAPTASLTGELSPAAGSSLPQLAPPALTSAVPPPRANDDDDSIDDDEPIANTVRPPVLASDSLQRELFPREPGRGTVRWVASALGLVGAAGTLLLLGLSPAGVPIWSGFAALTALGLVPMAYLARAAALLLFATLGMFAANLIHYGGARDGHALGLLAVITLLGQGLHFRAWHRASRLARALVALGIAGGLAWLAAIGSLHDLAVLDGNWRVWAPRLFELPLGILLMLALLAFMDARTTGGCAVWAVMLWLWYGSYLALSVLARAWAEQGTLLFALAHLGPGAVVPLANALLAPLWAMSSAQLLAGIGAVSRVAPRVVSGAVDPSENAEPL